MILICRHRDELRLLENNRTKALKLIRQSISFPALATISHKAETAVSTEQWVITTTAQARRDQTRH